TVIGPCALASGLLGQRPAYSAQHDLLVEWLFDKIGDPRLLGLDRECSIGMTADHDYRDSGTASFQRFSQLDSARAGHPDVGHDASAFKRRRVFQKCIGGRETSRANPGTTEKKLERPPRTVIVVDHIDDL